MKKMADNLNNHSDEEESELLANNDPSLFNRYIERKKAVRRQ